LAMIAMCYVVFGGDGFWNMQHNDILCLRTSAHLTLLVFHL